MKLSKYLILTILISILPLISIFITPALPHTHDGAVHLPRMAAYYKALIDGQILPRWAGDLNYGYGLPLFNFIYQTPYLIAAVFIHLGVSLVLTFKLLLAISYLLAAIFMFTFIKKFFKNEETALLVTLFYQFAPFRLIEMLVRGSLGEVYTYAFLPLVLFGLTSIFTNGNFSSIILTAIAAFLLIISHNSISLVFFGSAALFVILFASSKQNIIKGFTALGLGLLSSLFYWLPAMAEHQYTLGDLYMRDLFREHFPPFYQFILPNFFNSNALQTGGISVQIGVFHVAALILAIYFIVSRKNIADLPKKILIFSLLLTGLSLFFMTKTSVFIWEKNGFLRQFQFPWRLLSLISLSSSLAAISFRQLSWFKKPLLFWTTIILVVISTAYYWKPALGFDKVSDEKIYWNYPLDTTFFGETDVIWSAGPAKEYPKAPVLISEGKAQISKYFKKSTLHTYLVNAATNSVLIDNTQYFPGWRVYVDGQKVPVEFQNQLWRDLITFPVDKGEHSVKVAYEKSKIQFISEIISWVTLALLFMSLVIYRLKLTTKIIRKYEA